MLKIAAAEELIRLWNRDYTEGSLGRQEAMLYISQATNKYVREFLWAMEAEGEHAVPHMVLKEYDILSQYDSVRGEYYFDIPVRTLEMDDNNKGIYHVFPKGYEDQLWVPTATGFKGMTRGLDVSSLEGYISYRMIRGKLYVNNTDIGEGFELTVRLMPDAGDLGPDEQLPIGPDGEQDMLMLALNLTKIKMGTPADMIIDDTDK